MLIHLVHLRLLAVSTVLFQEYTQILHENAFFSPKTYCAVTVRHVAIIVNIYNSNSE